MKKICAVLLIICLFISLTACSSSPAAQPTSKSAQPAASAAKTSDAPAQTATTAPSPSSGGQPSPDAYWANANSQNNYDINQADQYDFDELFTKATPGQMISGLADPEPIVRWYCARVLPSLIGADANGTPITADLVREKLAAMKNDANQVVRDSAALGLSIVNNDYTSSAFTAAPDGKKAVVKLISNSLWLAQDSKVSQIYPGDGRSCENITWSPNSVMIAFEHGIHHGNEVLFYNAESGQSPDTPELYNVWDYLSRNIPKLKGFGELTADFYHINGWVDDNTLNIKYSYVMADSNTSIDSVLYYDMEKQAYSKILSCEKVTIDDKGNEVKRVSLM